MSTPSIEIHPGELPPFWDKNVTFFSNIHSMFFGNLGQMAKLEEHVQRLGAYGGRIVPILNVLYKRSPNLLVLEDTLDPTLVEYFQEHLGLEIPELAILPSDVYQMLEDAEKFRALNIHRDALDRIQTHPSVCLDGFVTDAVLARLAEDLGKHTVNSVRASHDGNNKLSLHEFQQAAGLPVFDTEVGATKEDILRCLGNFAQRGYQRAVVKSQIGASGLGMVVVDTRTATEDDLPDHLFFEGACMVQGWLDGSNGQGKSVASPSVQAFLTDSTVHLYEVTGQILDEHSVWEGNMAPAPHEKDFPPERQELLRQSAVVAEWLHGLGYRGTASVDFVLNKTGAGLQPIVCEINARLTGATYPSVLSRHFHPEGAWLMDTMTFEPLPGKELMQRLREAGLLYRRGKNSGTMPINFNLNMQGRVGSGQLLCLDTDLEHCLALLDKVRGALPLKERVHHD